MFPIEILGVTAIGAVTAAMMKAACWCFDYLDRREAAAANNRDAE